MDKRIIGAVGVGNRTFTAGQEAEFEIGRASCRERV